MSERYVFDPERLLRSLASNEVRFVLVGATAARLYGFPRMTADVDIVPAPAEEQAEVATASPHPPGDPHQPAAPPPQIPDVPAPEPESPVNVDVSQIKPGTTVEQPKDPADVPPQTKPGSGPLHP